MPFKPLNLLTFANYSPSNPSGLFAHCRHSLSWPPVSSPLKFCNRSYSLCCTSALERIFKRSPSVCSSFQLASSFRHSSAFPLLCYIPFRSEDQLPQAIVYPDRFYFCTTTHPPTSPIAA